LEKIPASEQEDEVTAGVINGLRMQVSDIKKQLAEYSRLKRGLETDLTAESFDDVGELVIKARITRGWSQADLAKALDMEPQQVQRYERNEWQKISLWRLQEVVEALNLDIVVHAQLHDSQAQGVELSPITIDNSKLHRHVMPTMGGALGISRMAVAGSTGGILSSGANTILHTKPSAIYESPQMMPGTVGTRTRKMPESFQGFKLGVRDAPTHLPDEGKEDVFELANSVA
jgi:ribosome-binding protein aMBF1 (putative translation factor)